MAPRRVIKGGMEALGGVAARGDMAAAVAAAAIVTATGGGGGGGGEDDGNLNPANSLGSDDPS